MLITGFPAGVFATNCWIVAAGSGSECLIIDPGQDSAPGVADLVSQHNLKPVAIVLTHGHLDHTWNVVPVAKGYDVPALIHPDDKARLADPFAFFGPQLRSYVEGLGIGPKDFPEPDRVEFLHDNGVVSIAGVDLLVRHAPGHTMGSVVFHEKSSATLFSGDVLFNQGIGRTDLPGSDPLAMERSLRDVILSFDDDTKVYPGHGDTTTIGNERQYSPYLAQFRTGA